MTHADQTLDALLSDIASNRIAPAGGTAAASGGAFGAALCEMVCIHTIETGDDAAVAAELADARDDLRRQRNRLLTLGETDARLVDDVFTGGGPIGDSDLKRSTGVPLTIAEVSLDVLESAVAVTETGTRTALADAGTGVFLAQSTLRASVFTVRSNLRQISDPAFVAKFEERVAEIETRGERASEEALANIEERM